MHRFHDEDEACLDQSKCGSCTNLHFLDGLLLHIKSNGATKAHPSNALTGDLVDPSAFVGWPGSKQTNWHADGDVGVASGLS